MSGIVGQVANVGIKTAARYFKSLHKLDVKIHRGLYGEAGGRGVRHGRDAGIFISQYIREGDDIDEQVPQEPGASSKTRKFSKARDRHQRKYNRCNCKRHRRNGFKR